MFPLWGLGGFLFYMPIELYNGRFQRLEVEDECIGQGAEGSIHQIIYPQALEGYVVKLYKDNERHASRQQKIEYLIKNIPHLKNEFSVIFPEDVIYQYGNFAGFLMKKAPGEYDLTTLCNLNNSLRLPASWHEKYNRNSPEGMRNRLKLCYNIASAFNQIHNTKKFTFVDIKPENIKVSFSGAISIVDIDSIAIADGSDLLFPAEKLTQEYSPVESKDVDLKNDLIDETWDRFSISVLFYKILFGLHPFTGTCRGNYSHLTANEQKIAEGLFPNGEKSKYFEQIPDPHKKFREMPKKIKKLFLDCFEKGHELPKYRPSASEWCQNLQNAKPKNYEISLWKNWAKNLTSSKSQEKTKEIAKNDQQANSQKPKGTEGLGLSLVLMTLIAFLGYGLSRYDSMLKKQAIQQQYGDYYKIAKVTKYNERMTHVDNYHFVDYYYKDVVWVLKDGKWGLINRQGESITPLQYDWVGSFKNDFAIVKQNDYYGFMNAQGVEITPLKYKFAQDFNEQGMALVKENNQYSFIDQKGAKIFDIMYDDISEFKEGLAIAHKNGSVGFIDMQGKLTIPLQFQEAHPFSEGLAGAMDGYGYWGFVNKTGGFSITPKYDWIGSFKNGKALVKQNGVEFYIDKTGNKL